MSIDDDDDDVDIIYSPEKTVSNQKNVSTLFEVYFFNVIVFISFSNLKIQTDQKTWLNYSTNILC